jgi:MFS transporter, putative metabolite transport protein
MHSDEPASAVVVSQSLDDIPLNKFHIRATVFCAGSAFVDGYFLGMIGFALAIWGPQVGLSDWWVGSLAAASLFGLLIGALVIGRITDFVGRRLLFTIHLIVLLVLAVAQALVTEPVQLLVIRFLIGLCIGGDFAIASTYLIELVPRRQRGKLMSLINVSAVVGIAVTFLVAEVLGTLGESSWRWMLATTVVPVAVVLILRHGAPESPRWLMAQGRQAEAESILTRFFGDGVRLNDTEPTTGTPQARGGYGALFTSTMWRRTLFSGIFWACQAAPFYAIFLFQTQVFDALGLTEGFWGNLLFNAFLVVGVLVGIPVVNRAPRRAVLLSTFAISAFALAVLGIAPSNGSTVLVLAFATFGLISSIGANLSTVYPGELFPTHVRATGVGLAAAISRLGSVVGTFLLPHLLQTWGLNASMFVLAGVAVLGLVVSLLWAPRTEGVKLAEASSI